MQKIKRTKEFDLSLEIKDPNFIRWRRSLSLVRSNPSPPIEKRLSWTMQRSWKTGKSR